jgi:DNA-binding SARP family transcriptional activator/WD40 repeat protein
VWAVIEHAEGIGIDRFQFRVLGPVQVLDQHGVAIDVGGPKPRLVLVQLLLNPNRVVSSDALVDALWGDDPPPTARRSLQSHVAKLRAALGGDDGPLRSQSPGYVLVVDESQIDLCRSEDLMRQARASLLSNPRRSHLLAQQAQKEWSSEPLGDLATHDQLVAQRRRLDHLWLDLIELDLDAELAVGNTAEAVEQLESLVLDRPEHEPFWARLMTAYYRLGRQSDALRAFQRARAALLEAFGIDPSPELQRLEVAILGQTAELDGVPAPACPYKGLASYQLDDAELFYGRDDLVAELVEAVRAAPFVVVVGSSGAGKSSALRAGLVKAVEARKLSDFRHASVITPGTVPLRSIYQVPTSADVIIVDQFEELFTLTDDEATQREFVRLLVGRVNDTSSRVVISLRADFYGYCTRIPELAPLLARRQVVVGPLSEQELRVAITKPAEKAGLVVAHELVDTIIAEAANHAGALPLVSHALVETWHRRNDDQLTLEAYREAGSIAAAIARTAERVYDSFPPAQQAQTEQLFLRLVEPGDGTEHARRKVAHEQLAGSSIDREVIDVLVEARLLTAGADGIEMAHEALIEAWPRLRSWIDDNRDGIRLHRHLTAAASAWAELGHDEGELYRGARLSAALSWIADAAPDLSDLERDFVDAAVGVSETELRRHVRANRRLRILVALSVVGVLVAATATVLAVSKADDADRGRAQAEAAQLVLTVRNNPDLSASAKLQLAVEADRRASTPDTRGLLLDVITQDLGFTAGRDTDLTLTGHTPTSANGGVLLGIDNNVLGLVLDTRTLEPRKQGLRNVAAVVDTGSRLLGVRDTTALEIIDVDTGRIVGTPPGVSARPSQIGLSRDGTTLAVANESDDVGTRAGITLYDVTSGRPRLTVSAGGDDSISDVTFSLDGRTVLAVIGDSRVVGWDTATGTTIFDSTGPFESSGSATAVTRLAMSPAGDHIALGREDGDVEMWTTDDEGLWHPGDVRSPHHDEINWIDFDSEGGRLVSTSRDGVVSVWYTTTGSLATDPRTSGLKIAVTFFRPDSSTHLVSLDTSGQIWEWDVERDAELSTTVPGVNLGATVAASPETRVLVSSATGATIYDPTGEAQREVLFDWPEEPTRAVAASVDGTRFVSLHDDHIELRDSVSGDVVMGPLGPVTNRMVALDRGGSRVAFQGLDQRIHVIDDDGTAMDPINLSLQRRNLQALDLSDDGRELVISTQVGEAIWYDLEGIGAAPLTTSPGTAYDAQFVSGGRVAVVGAGALQIINPRSRQTTTRFDLGIDARKLAIDSTGRLLATSGGTGSIQLWDADLVKPIGEALQVRNVSSSVPIRFSADGHYLLVSGPEETTWINVSTADWPLVACSLVTDNSLESAEACP